jgi:tripartite-type tricarboxylate transporter receptor subunit TctC
MDDMVNVPYKSNPLSIADLIGGQVDFMFADASSSEAVKAFQAAESRKWGQVIRAAGIQPE